MSKKNSILVALVSVLIALLFLSVFYVAVPLLEKPEGDNPEVEYPEVAVDSEDNLHIVWDDGRDSEIYAFEGGYLTTRVYYAKFDADGRRLIDDKPITSGGGGYPSMEIDSSDNVWVAYSMNGSFLLKLDTEGERVFEKKVLDQYDSAVLVTVGSDDNIYLSWHECWQLKCFRYYTALDSEGGILTDRSNLSMVSPISGFPIVMDNNGKYVHLDRNGTTDSDGNVHIVRHSQHGNLYHTKINSSGEIEIDNSQITTDGIWDYALKVGIDPFDNIHVVAGTRWGIGYLKLDNMGNVLRRISDVAPETRRGAEEFPDLDIDSSGNVYIVWHVIETTLPYPMSGLEEYSYFSYCARIDAEGYLGDTWLVAESRWPQRETPEPLVAILIAVLVALALILSIILWKLGRRGHVQTDTVENREK